MDKEELKKHFSVAFEEFDSTIDKMHEEGVIPDMEITFFLKFLFEKYKDGGIEQLGGRIMGHLMHQWRKQGMKLDQFLAMIEWLWEIQTTNS